MSFIKFFGGPVRLISRSSIRAKVPSLGSVSKKEKINIEDKVKLPVESDSKILIEYVCGTNLLSEGGENVKLKPDSEYPEWLWNIRSPPPFEELDKNSKTYWNRVRKQRQKEEKYLKLLRRTATVHKHFLKRKTKPAWFVERDRDNSRRPAPKKVEEASFQEKPKLKTGGKWTEERKREHSERMKEYWKSRKEKEKNKKRKKVENSLVLRWPNRKKK